MSSPSPYIKLIPDYPSNLKFEQYKGEHQLPAIHDMLKASLSEPYSVYTYRFFLNIWPELCILIVDYNEAQSLEWVQANRGKRELGPCADSGDAAAAPAEGKIIGVIMSKLEDHASDHKQRSRGYIGMLAVLPEYRGVQLGSSLVIWTFEICRKKGTHEMVLETEIDNVGSLRLYERLGFVREKRLTKYYTNGMDAFRLKALILNPVG